MPALWESWKKSLVCKSEPGDVHDPQTVSDSKTQSVHNAYRFYRSGCSRSLKNLRDVIHGSRREFNKPMNCSPRSVESSDLFQNVSEEAILRGQRLRNWRVDEITTHNSTSRCDGLESGITTHRSVRGTPSKRFSGCYDCSLAQNPALSVVVYKGASVTCSTPLAQPVCQRCGEIFTRYEALEHHHVLKHAVVELDVGDSSRNIVEIIFTTSWLKSEKPNVKIDRVLKIYNMPKTLARFEEYRDFVKTKANKLPKKHPRCLADGNELLRFYATTFWCSLGMNGSSRLCTLGSCNVCRIIRWGLSQKKEMGGGIHTASTSGRAHDLMRGTEDGMGRKMAMLVCRVVAGRVYKGHESKEAIYPPNGFDSVAGGVGRFANIEDLYIFNSKAILPCFVVIYGC